MEGNFLNIFLDEYKNKIINSEILVLKEYKDRLDSDKWKEFIDKYKERFIETETYYINNLCKNHYKEENNNFIDLSRKFSHNIFNEIISSLEN